MRSALFTVARSMVAKGVKKQIIRADAYEVCVVTKGNHASIGPIAGMHFTAVIESELRVTQASYIVPTGELVGLEQAVWEEVPFDDPDDPSLN